MLNRRRNMGERQSGILALFLVSLTAFTACSLLDSSSPDEDDDEDAGAGGDIARGGRGLGGNAGTVTGGVSGAAPQGGDSGSSAGGAGGTPPATGGTPAGGTPSTGGADSGGGALPTGGVATGGASGASTGGTGGSGGPIECGTGWAVNDGGYVTAPGTSGCWRGYGYTGTGAVGSTITPANFGTCGSPCMLCASGTVAADIMYSGVGLLGFNLNQMADSETSATVTPTGAALSVSFTNPGGSGLRVQIGGPNAATSETDRWCYALSGSSGTITIPYSSFTTTCWNTTGIAYARQPLQTVQLLVPGDDVTPVPFNMCLTGVSDS